MNRDDPATTAELLEGSAAELYEDAPCGYLATAPDGTILKVNRTFLAWTGYETDELVGTRRFYDLLPAGAKIYYETHYAPLLQMQGRVREIALEVIRADGVRLPVLVNASLKSDESGTPMFARITVFDASDRRRYERELLETRNAAEERAAAASALEHVAEGVVLVDEEGRIRILNPAAERILGLSLDGARGSRLGAVLPGWDALAGRVVVPVRGVEASPVVVPLSVGGVTRWLAVSAEAAAEGIVYTLRDVTEERRLNEFRDDIVAIVSHELRTPLTGVYGAAKTLVALGDRLDDGQRHSLLLTVADQAERLVGIVEKILMTERLDSGDVAVERASFDVAELVTRVAVKDAAVDVRVEADDLVAEGDPALFEQVLVNLLDNAAKYGPAGAAVRVVVQRVRERVRVTVTDAGGGIPSADRERVFEKFMRLDPDQARGVGGTGLGLYIGRELVRRMNGRIGVLPTETGTTFFVDLPHHRA